MKQNTRGLSLTAGILFLILGVYLIGAVILDIITLEIHAPYAQQYVLAAFLDYLGLLAIGIGLICRSRAVVLAGSLWQAVIYALSLVSWVNWAYWQEASPAGRAAVFASAYVQGGLRNLLLFLLMFFILITLILALCRAKALKSLWLLPLIPAALCLAWSAAGPFLVSLVLALPAATLTEILAALGADLLAYILLVAMDVVLFFAVLFFCLWNRRQPAPLQTPPGSSTTASKPSGPWAPPMTCVSPAPCRQRRRSSRQPVWFYRTGKTPLRQLPRLRKQ